MAYFDTYECAWCAEDYYGSPGGVCDDCQRDAERGTYEDAGCPVCEPELRAIRVVSMSSTSVV